MAVGVAVDPHTHIFRCPASTSQVVRILSVRCVRLDSTRRRGEDSSIPSSFSNDDDDDESDLCVPVWQWRIARTSNDHVSTRTLRVMAVFGEHGRELISAELGIQLMHRLLHLDSNHDSRQSSCQFESDDDKFLWEHVEFTVCCHRSQQPCSHDDCTLLIQIFPLMNPFSHQSAITVNPCARTNEHGVDLNRNYEKHC